MYATARHTRIGRPEGPGNLLQIKDTYDRLEAWPSQTQQERPQKPRGPGSPTRSQAGAAGGPGEPGEPMTSHLWCCAQMPSTASSTVRPSSTLTTIDTTPPGVYTLPD